VTPLFVAWEPKGYLKTPMIVHRVAAGATNYEAR